MSQAIERAYRAHAFVPSKKYRQGQRKKVDNPVRRAPEHLKVMTWRGEADMGLERAREVARQAIAEPEAQRLVNELDWDGLLEFLNAITVFLKAGPELQAMKNKKKSAPPPMRRFEDRACDRLDTSALTQAALALAATIDDAAQRNKMQRMAGHVTRARSKWEALAGLARFYPRQGIPRAYVNKLVEHLEQIDLLSFKRLVTQSVIFHRAGIAPHSEEATDGK